MAMDTSADVRARQRQVDELEGGDLLSGTAIGEFATETA
jgi:hypothetical protein